MYDVIFMYMNIYDVDNRISFLYFYRKYTVTEYQ